MGRKHRHRFHGDAKRFEVVAAFIYDRYGRGIQHIADVAGGQGMLCRILRKKYNYDCVDDDFALWVFAHSHYGLMGFEAVEEGPGEKDRLCE